MLCLFCQTEDKKLQLSYKNTMSSTVILDNDRILKWAAPVLTSNLSWELPWFTVVALTYIDSNTELFSFNIPQTLKKDHLRLSRKKNDNWLKEEIINYCCCVSIGNWLNASAAGWIKNHFMVLVYIFIPIQWFYIQHINNFCCAKITAGYNLPSTLQNAHAEWQIQKKVNKILLLTWKRFFKPEV